MAICDAEASGSTYARFFGNIVASDIEGAFFFDVFAQIKLDLADYLAPYTDANTAYFCKYKSLIQITEYDAATIKEFGGLPSQFKFGYYGYEFAGFTDVPEFISVPKQITKPSFIWVTSADIPDIGAFAECTGNTGLKTIRSSLQLSASPIETWGTKALFEFNQSVKANIQLVYVAEQINAFFTGEPPSGVWLAL